MNLETLTLRDAVLDPILLRDAAENPNKMEPEQLSMLAEAIRRKGFLQPILVRPVGDQYEIIDGHHRTRAAREVGLTEIPCLVATNCSDEDASALRIGMNRFRGELDLASTARLMQGLIDKGWKLDDLTITGFSGDEVADLVRSLRVEEVDIKVFDEGLDDVGDDAPAAKPFTLEILFTNRDDLKRAKKALKKAAGKSGDFAKGLLRLIGD